jgi:hypothetical protein
VLVVVPRVSRLSLDRRCPKGSGLVVGRLRSRDSSISAQSPHPASTEPAACEIWTASAFVNRIRISEVVTAHRNGRWPGLTCSRRQSARREHGTMIEAS